MPAFNANWVLILALLASVAILGGVLIWSARRCILRCTRVAVRLVGLAFVLGSIALLVEVLPYFYALHLEAQWSPSKPRTREELEAFLSLYSRREIHPSQSHWGRDYALRPGEQMIQYLILWRAPLDVVYSSNDAVVAIYTSYE